MRGNFELALAEVLSHEGGFVNHPRDPGGMTNLGVTKRVYEEWIGHPVNEAIMRGLTVDKVRSLYRAKYWLAARCDDLPAGIDLCVFDFAVNAGPSRAVRFLQRLVKATEDGVIGPKTIAAVSKRVTAGGVAPLIREYQDARRVYYRRLPTFDAFGRGWLRRTDLVEASALRMASRRIDVQAPKP